jgi:hypothetical protein
MRNKLYSNILAGTMEKEIALLKYVNNLDSSKELKGFLPCFLQQVEGRVDNTTRTYGAVAGSKEFKSLLSRA